MQTPTDSNAAQTAIAEDGVQAATAKPAASRRQLALKILISIGILALLARIVDWQEFARIASGARADLLLLAGALMAVEILMVSARWKLLLAPVGVAVTFMQALRSYLKGHIVGYFVPASAASDVVKAVDVNMARSKGTASQGVEVVSSIFVERGLGAISVAVAVLLGLSISPLAGAHYGMGKLLVLAAAALIGVCVAALFADRLFSLVPARHWQRLPRVHAMVERARKSMITYRRMPYALAALMVFSLVIQGMRVVPVYILAVAIGEGGVFFAYLIAVPVIFMVNTIPVLGSRIGTEQGLFVFFLGLAGVNPEAALVVALLKLVIGIIVALPGGYWLIKGRTRSAEQRAVLGD